MTLSSLEFTKINGAGNDFIFIDNRELGLGAEQRVALAKSLCRRMFSVGADGIMFIEESANHDFAWNFYNADGSLAEMCGNGARCAGKYAFERRIAGKTMSFETLAGIIYAQVKDDGQVQIEMTAPEDYRAGLSIDLDEASYEMDFLNTGVPHAIVYVEGEQEAIDTVPMKSWGGLVRHHQQFAPAGTNANFVWRKDDNTLVVRTYERGVEDETMACGTGAVAAALCVAKKYGFQSPVNIVSSGGEQLSISFENTELIADAKPFLTGPARIVYEGILTSETLKSIFEE